MFYAEDTRLQKSQPNHVSDLSRCHNQKNNSNDLRQQKWDAINRPSQKYLQTKSSNQSRRYDNNLPQKNVALTKKVLRKLTQKINQVEKKCEEINQSNRITQKLQAYQSKFLVSCVECEHAKDQQGYHDSNDPNYSLLNLTTTSLPSRDNPQIQKVLKQFYHNINHKMLSMKQNKLHSKVDNNLEWLEKEIDSNFHDLFELQQEKDMKFLKGYV